jgi:hypothetical protein
MIADDFYGDRFRWFTGVVKDIADDRARVRVRIFGIHHTEDLTRVSNDDLPWAMVLYPTTGGQTSSGVASHGLKVGSWVVGFFADGEDSQQPIIMGVINGGENSMNNSPGGTPSPQSSGNNSSNPNAAYNGGGVDQATEGTPSTSMLVGSTNAKKVYNYFWEKISKEGSFTGDIKCIVAAIVGNFMVESGDSIDPQAYNPNDRGMPSLGIAQWRADRATCFLKFCGYNLSTAKKGSLPPLENQLDYVWHEFHSSERNAYNKLLTSTTIQDAAANIIYYERDASYQKLNGVWTVNRESNFYLKKLKKPRDVLSSFSYTGGVGGER